MPGKIRIALLFSAFIFYSLRIMAGELAIPQGTAKEDFHEYPAINVVFDVQMTSGGDFNGLYESAKEVHDTLRGNVVVVIYGTVLALFAKQHYPQYQKTVDQLAGLAQQGVRFYMGNKAMQVVGYKTKDLYGFVTVVPSGLAEIAYLQADGYRYLRLAPKKEKQDPPVKKPPPSDEEPRFKFSY